ncbi:hypothetical protein MUBE_02160 [Mycobacterium uberis]|uniref:Uncharacterized protein n=1 Tax=Mycobacterium uberis TaxID=2162698 RepID=A0A3E1HK78_9MYCO|nr:hypothetical protein MUBE_02160 [Mycobacterium uberis]
MKRFADQVDENGRRLAGAAANYHHERARVAMSCLVEVPRLVGVGVRAAIVDQGPAAALVLSVVP